MKLAYLVQPYTCSPQAAYEFALAVIARETLYNTNVTILSPIVHYHEVAAKYNLPIDFRFWLPRNFEFIRKADEIRIVCAEGLLESVGCIVEEEFAKHLKLPIYFYALDSAIQGQDIPYRSLASYHWLQRLRSYGTLIQEINTEMGVKRAREAATKLA